MNKERNEIDRLAGDLLKKSLEKPKLHNFDDVLMNKIHELPLPSTAPPTSSLFKNGWKFLILSLILLIISLLIISYLSAGAYSDVGKYLMATKMYILYGGMALFVPLLFTQLDALLKLMFENHYHIRMNY